MTIVSEKIRNFVTRIVVSAPYLTALTIQMEAKKVLFISQEVYPYVPETSMSKL